MIRSDEAALRRVVELGHQSGERTPWAKTVGTCKKLLPVADGLWTFLTIKGIEPTNNAAVDNVNGSAGFNFLTDTIFNVTGLSGTIDAIPFLMS